MFKQILKLTAFFPIMFFIQLSMYPESVYIQAINIYFSESGSVRVFVILTLAFGMLFPVRKACRRNYISEAAYNVLPIEVFLRFVFAQYHMILSGILLLLLLIICALIFCWIDTRYATQIYLQKNWKKNSKKGKEMRNQMMYRMMIFSISSMLFLPSIISIAVYEMRQPSYSAEQAMDSSVKSNNRKYRKNIEKMVEEDEVLKKHLCNWNDLTISEKMESMQSIANIETSYLGITDVKVKSMKLSLLLRGQYDNREKQVWIDIRHIQKDSFEECCSTILHEVYHSYQHYVVETIDWEKVSDCLYYREAKEWEDNFKNYISGYDVYDDYYNQEVEADARAFAKKEMIKICSVMKREE